VHKAAGPEEGVSSTSRQGCKFLPGRGADTQKPRFHHPPTSRITAPCSLGTGPERRRRGGAAAQVPLLNINRPTRHPAHPPPTSKKLFFFGLSKKSVGPVWECLQENVSDARAGHSAHKQYHLRKQLKRHSFQITQQTQGGERIYACHSYCGHLGRFLCLGFRTL
jgi:hypothetical protein